MCEYLGVGFGTRRTSKKLREASNPEYRIQKAEIRTTARMPLRAGMEAEGGFVRKKLRIFTGQAELGINMGKTG
jgi:hypothetical protein